MNFINSNNDRSECYLDLNDINFNNISNSNVHAVFTFLSPKNNQNSLAKASLIIKLSNDKIWKNEQKKYEILFDWGSKSLS